MHKVKHSKLAHSTDDEILLTKIIVPSEYAKAQWLAASQYIHDLKEVETYYNAVNLIAHLHRAPFLIEVQP